MQRTSAQPDRTGGSECKGSKRISPPEPGRVAKVFRCVPEFLAAISQCDLPLFRFQQAEFANLLPDVAGIRAISLPMVLTRTSAA
jgi:hypothetical protein